jgi:hypothetical protein
MLASYSVLFADLPKLPISVPGVPDDIAFLGAVGLGAFLVLLLLFTMLRRGKKADPEAGLAEDLSTLPPAPKGQRHYQLTVMNQPARLRLVVIAPVGKKTVGKVDSALEQVFRGLGEVSFDDKPRIRIWPAQLSTTGFPPTFFRLTKSPDAEGRPSRFIMLAGPARAGAMPVLLGLVVEVGEPSKLGKVTMTETQWGEVLRVEPA